MELRIADLLQSEGLDLGVTPWLTITQARIDAFADATEDFQWIHVDPERAELEGLGRTIAHGYLTLSLVPYFFRQLLVLPDQDRSFNYGLNKVRFPAPVAEGSELRMRGQLGTVTARDDAGVIYSLNFELERRGVGRPGAVGEVVYLAYPRG